MRYHVRCQNLNGVIVYYPQVCQNINIIPQKNGKGHCESFNTNDIVKENTQVTVGGSSSINDFNKYQLDMLVYTYPYHMQKVDRMKPYDYQVIFITSEDMNTL